MGARQAERMAIAGEGSHERKGIGFAPDGGIAGNDRALHENEITQASACDHEGRARACGLGRAVALGQRLDAQRLLEGGGVLHVVGGVSLIRWTGPPWPSNARILTGLLKQVGAICPEPRLRPGTAPVEV